MIRSQWPMVRSHDLPMMLCAMIRVKIPSSFYKNSSLALPLRCRDDFSQDVLNKSWFILIDQTSADPRVPAGRVLQVITQHPTDLSGKIWTHDYDDEKPKYVPTAIASEIFHTHHDGQANFIEVLHLLYVAIVFESYDLRTVRNKEKIAADAAAKALENGYTGELPEYKQKAIVSLEKKLLTKIEPKWKELDDGNKEVTSTQLFEYLADLKYLVDPKVSDKLGLGPPKIIMIYRDFELVYNNLGGARVALIRLPITVDVSALIYLN